MGSLSTPMISAAGIGMSAVQSKQAASQAQIQAELSASATETKALRSELEAEAVLELGRLDQIEAVNKGRADIAAQKTDYAHSGVSVNSGSAVSVAADKAAWTEYDRQKIEYEAAAESWGLKYDAQLLRQDAHNARVSGASSGSSTAQILVESGKQLSSILFS